MNSMLIYAGIGLGVILGLVILAYIVKFFAKKIKKIYQKKKNKPKKPKDTSKMSVKKLKEMQDKALEEVKVDEEKNQKPASEAKSAVSFSQEIVDNQEYEGSKDFFDDLELDRNSEDTTSSQEAELDLYEQQKQYEEFITRHAKDAQERRKQKEAEEAKNLEKQRLDDDSFEQFRSLRTYSRFVADKTLVSRILKTPPDKREILFNNLFKQVNYDDYDMFK